MPIPVTKDIDVEPDDVVIFDAEGYPALRDFLKKNKVRHVLLTGYATDMCYCRTTAGYQNLSKDFNVFLVGDASLATFPSNGTPAVRHQRRPVVRRPRPVDHADLLGPLHGTRGRGSLTSEGRMHRTNDPTRRRFLAAAAAGISGVGSAAATAALRAAEDDKALIAITLDLEMSRNFPTRDDTHWDYEKGNLNAETKAYTVEACRRVKAAGGVLHCFAVGRVFEQENVDWLKGIVQAGHPVGNHTYDHVNVLATRPEDVQFRFQRAPWLIEGRTPAEVIRDNIRLATAAMKARLGCEPAGFRTPGGFSDGLRTRPDVRAMLREQGFDWVSSLYPPHATPRPMEEPGADGLREHRPGPGRRPSRSSIPTGWSKSR